MNHKNISCPYREGFFSIAKLKQNSSPCEGTAIFYVKNYCFIKL